MFLSGVLVSLNFSQNRLVRLVAAVAIDGVVCRLRLFLSTRFY